MSLFCFRPMLGSLNTIVRRARRALLKYVNYTLVIDNKYFETDMKSYWDIQRVYALIPCLT